MKIKQNAVTTLSAAPLFFLSITFQHVPGTVMRLSHIGRSLEMWLARSRAVINEWQFQLSLCYRIGDPSGVS